MEAIGGVSAVTAVLEFGFSLATAIHAYVGDYKDAPEDIISLAKDIDAVTYEIQAIRSLVEHDQAARDLDQANSRIAEKCVGDLKSALARLSELLSEAGISTDSPKDIVLTTLEISRRMKAQWPFIKTRVEEVQQKLDRTRIQILLARTCIEYRVSPAVEKREQAKARIPGLFKLVERQQLTAEPLYVRTTGPKARKTPGPDTSMSRRRVEYNSVDDDVRQRRRNTRLVSDQADVRSNASYTSEHALQANQYFQKGQNHVLHKLRDEEASNKRDAAELEKLRDEIRQELRDEKSQEDTEAARLERIREDAIRDYKIKEEKRRALEDETRKRLESFFDTSPKERIDEYMQAVQGQGLEIQMNGLAIVPPARAELSPQDAEDSPGSANENKPTQKRVRFSPLSFWKKKPPAASISFDRAEHEGSGSSNTATNSEYPRHPRSSASPYSLDDAAASTNRAQIRLAHLVLSYHTDFINNDECSPFDGTELPHYPCEAMCEFRTTMSVWSRVPQGSKTLAQYHARKFFGALNWELHATVPIEPGPKRRGAFPYSTVFRNKSPPMHRGKHVVLVIFSAVDNDVPVIDQATNATRISQTSSAETDKATKAARISHSARTKIDQAAKATYISHNSNAEPHGTLTLPKLLAIREWLRSHEVRGELGAIDTEIEKRIGNQGSVRAKESDSTSSVAQRSDHSAGIIIRGRTSQPKSRPDGSLLTDSRQKWTKVSRYRVPSIARDNSAGYENLTYDDRPGNQLYAGQNLKGLSPQRITSLPLETDYDYGVETGRGRRAYDTLPDGTAVYEVARFPTRPRSRNPPFLDETSAPRVLDFGFERRPHLPRPLQLLANGDPPQSYDESVRSDAEALDLALTLYTGGGVSRKETLHPPDDAEKLSHASQHASAEHEQTWLSASPEPMPGSLKVSSGTACQVFTCN